MESYLSALGSGENMIISFDFIGEKEPESLLVDFGLDSFSFLLNDDDDDDDDGDDVKYGWANASFKEIRLFTW